MKTLAEFDALLPDEEACRKALMAQRWPDGIVKCSRCGNEKVWALPARPYHWVCKSGKETTDKQTGEVLTCRKNGGYRFSLTTATIFENTKIPLKMWFKIGYLMLTARRGSALYSFTGSCSVRIRRMPIGLLGMSRCVCEPRCAVT